MPWMVETYKNAVCGTELGIIKGVFGVSLFTASETEEIVSLKKLTLAVLQKSPEIATDSVICEAIQNGQKSALETFAKNAPKEALAAGVVAVAALVCTKALKPRFTEVLMGACMNLVGC